MGIFDGPISSFDWNGDGAINSRDDAFFLSMVSQLEENNGTYRNSNEAAIAEFYRRAGLDPRK